MNAIKKGFYSVIPKEIVNIFHSYELDFLFSGQGEIDLEDWKANTIYKGNYHENHPVSINNFIFYNLIEIFILIKLKFLGYQRLLGYND